jgi:hypothetical protein
MGDIFISYARENISVAENLAKEFEAQGWSVWWDRTIPPGKTWRNIIGEALRNAKCIVVLWSKNSVQSQWVITEADYGINQNKLIPIFIEQVDPPLGFGGIQAADITGWKPGNPHFGITALITAVNSIFGSSISQSANLNKEDLLEKEHAFSEKPSSKELQDNKRNNNLESIDPHDTKIIGLENIPTKSEKPRKNHILNLKTLIFTGTTLGIVFFSLIVYQQYFSSDQNFQNNNFQSTNSSKEPEISAVIPKASSFYDTSKNTNMKGFDSGNLYLSEANLIIQIDKVDKYIKDIERANNPEEIMAIIDDHNSNFKPNIEKIQQSYEKAEKEGRLTDLQKELYKNLFERNLSFLFQAEKKIKEAQYYR